MIKKRILFILCVLFFFILLFVPFYFAVSMQPLSSKVNYKRIEVPSGISVKQISDKLKKERLIRSRTVFYFSARYPFFYKFFSQTPQTFVLKSGVYNISPSMSVTEILSMLSSGRQDYIRISFPEGITISKIANKLDNMGVCSYSDFIKACRDKDLLSEYKIPLNSFEGYLFPDTYFFTPMMNAKSCVRFMADNFFDKINGIEKLSELNENELANLIILASIVEREYRIESEAPLIASVFKNRLSRRIGLYSCATVEYIITEIHGRPHPDKITYEDLAMESPYNTYKWAGLPPGPISNPGLVAIDAAFKPADTGYFFFRLVDETTGKHVFTKDFSTHITEGYSRSTKK